MNDAPTCVEPAETGVDLEEPRGRGRRYALMASATAFVAGLASLLQASPAAADCQGSPCCSLASCTVCSWSGSRDQWTCPSGYNKTWWTCVSAGSTYVCGECSGGTNCWSGPWPCSIWYRTA